MPDPALRDEVPEDLPWLLRLLPRADVYCKTKQLGSVTNTNGSMHEAA
jgi:hypothetical protein